MARAITNAGRLLRATVSGIGHVVWRVTRLLLVFLGAVAAPFAMPPPPPPPRPTTEQSDGGETERVP